MKINTISGVTPFFKQGLNSSNNENNIKNYQINLLKKDEFSLSFGASGLPVNKIKEFIKQLNSAGKNYEFFQTKKGVTVVELRDVTKIIRTTTFMPDSRKKVIEYKPDGRNPNLSFLYEKDKLKKTTRFSVEGKKTFTETYSNKGQRESLIIYSKTVDLPIKKTIFQKDGKTPKQETFFYEGTKDIKAVKEYRKNGTLMSIKTFVQKEN